MLFMSAGCALAASDYMRYCDVLREVVQCVYLASGAALCFMAFVSFLLSVAWGAWRRNSWIPSSGKVPHDAPNTIETVLQSGATSDVLVLGNTELDRERATTSTTMVGRRTKGRDVEEGVRRSKGDVDGAGVSWENYGRKVVIFDFTAAAIQET
uniref:Uncharacterized protein n=1 Tax=Hyaloperonospora arabidopsidis (strain Emoy2) TaxID=559515 RepID=M4BJH6_HYAAE